MRFVTRHAWLIVVAVLWSVALIPTSASAGTTRTITGFGGSGPNGLTCPDGSTTGAGINFQATKFASGSFDYNSGLNIGNQGGTSKQGQISSGNISKNSYSLSGVLGNDQCNNSSEPTPATFTVSGKCGDNVLIKYSDSNGEKGVFLGDVHCGS
jgi:hypothetical protein